MRKDSVTIRKMGLVLSIILGLSGHHLEHHKYFKPLQINQIIEQAEILISRRKAIKSLRKINTIPKAPFLFYLATSFKA